MSLLKVITFSCNQWRLVPKIGGAAAPENLMGSAAVHSAYMRAATACNNTYMLLRARRVWQHERPARGLLLLLEEYGL